ncbi:formyltransferase family protein (plasmid) [Halorientalis pallida]|uniref:formyltransferase family protein n=1 Tax=Halorientalis pallida TaxID=2479928 RepID=UPI003C6F26F9
MDVCLFLSGTTVRDWQAEALEQVVAADDVTITSILYSATESDRSLGDTLRRGLEVREWAVVNAVNARLRPRGVGTEHVHIDRVLDRDGITERAVRPRIVDGWKQEIPGEVVDAVAGEADVAVRFGFNFVVGPVLTAFEYGVLSYHHGDLREYRGQPAGFWEFVHDADTAGITVQRLTEAVDAGDIAALRTVDIGDCHTWEAIRRRLYAASGDMLLPALRAVRDGRAREPDRLGDVYTLPSGRPVFEFAVQNAAGHLRERLSGATDGRAICVG